MTLKFDKDLDVLEEAEVRLIKSLTTLYFYANNSFTVSVYKVSKTGLKTLVKTIDSNAINEIQFDITRFDDGFLTIHPCQAGSTHDCFVVSNDYNHLIVIPNGACTMEFYE